MQSLINHIVRGESRLQIFQTLKILPTRLSWSRKIPSTFLTWSIDCAAVSNMWLVWLYIDNMCVTIHVKIAIFTLTCDRLFSFSSSAKVQSLALNNVRPSREWEKKKRKKIFSAVWWTTRSASHWRRVTLDRSHVPHYPIRSSHWLELENEQEEY